MSSEEYLKTDHQLSSPVFKFEVYGEELICKKVKRSGGCGHFYVPASWSGKHIKIMDGKSLPMSGLDPAVYQSGQYRGKGDHEAGNRHLRRIIGMMTPK
ncbi:DUF2080 family transposase-associated protein [Syntrophus aciditrophicus]|uniref:Transposase n=1 Tax=Syntrophus aciditrophicus (strain SB) TaxID=56780 RepID=Q2LPX1_SYNAS|nr:DUF2080 family transposase-associated protein [Syntrophus aciditrophicus]ABC76321.1 transposase [Syntrophus aciditrophicus SB]